MYAVITTGGKQYLVSEGQKLKVEKLEQNVGDVITFEAMLVADNDGTSVKVGAPMVAGSKVTAKIVGHDRAEKVSIIKYKPKVRYRRNVGHRQPFTEIQIETIA
ncbi:MAG: 50S ribosomal protein L21 [Candidatus Uhrbacteria bacterium GW2011_GWD2_52_7]|uniref:Large ribosomal subunit protein bL21 n=1 Tax=Candidatus Uhrbacteria bacterium GW2011_GWD2_52_7 TaxID=1618989 RepID=A0A0G2AEF3_9BACT|nr:MAG: 50S ribosomal protein L21 [Candidatus Uhrbacteria bacterium GW2011_GWD2_52_7]